jgi:hypothetical protein
VSASVVSLRASHSSRTAILRLESESESKEMRLRENLARAYETIRAYELLLHDSGDGGRGLGGIADISLLEGMSGDHRPPTMPSNQSAWNDSAQSHPPLPITVLDSIIHCKPRVFSFLLVISFVGTFDGESILI